MSNSRFYISNVLDGPMVETDLCQSWANQVEPMSQQIQRGLRMGLSRANSDWGMAESNKAAFSQIEPEAIAHWLTESNIERRHQIQQAFVPSFEGISVSAPGVRPKSPGLN